MGAALAPLSPSHKENETERLSQTSTPLWRRRFHLDLPSQDVLPFTLLLRRKEQPRTLGRVSGCVCVRGCVDVELRTVCVVFSVASVCEWTQQFKD